MRNKEIVQILGGIENRELSTALVFSSGHENQQAGGHRGQGRAETPATAGSGDHGWHREVHLPHACTVTGQEALQKRAGAVVGSAGAPCRSRHMTACAGLGSATCYPGNVTGASEPL